LGEQFVFPELFAFFLIARSCKTPPDGIKIGISGEETSRLMRFLPYPVAYMKNFIYTFGCRIHRFTRSSLLGKTRYLIPGLLYGENHFMANAKNKVVDIILVEDDASDSEFFVGIFNKVAPERDILVIRDGREILEYLFGIGSYAGRDINAAPKVIFLDLKLPKANGIEVLQAMKDDPHTKTIPVVIFSSSAEEQDIEMCYSLGASSYVVKPVDHKEYTEVVKSLAGYWLKINQPPG
jgi:two-component system response regulator